jgi:dipeptidyl aminopeptidase/acylaminoacyl peptidase
MPIRKTVFITLITLSCALALVPRTQAQSPIQNNVQNKAQNLGKPQLTLDDFFNSVSFTALEVSPDGRAVVIVTERADWDQQIFRHDLWLYRDWLNPDDAGGGTLIQLTQSGHDTDPKWSPDGRWIAFLSDRKTPAEKSADSDSDDEKAGGDQDKNAKDKDKDDETTQLYLISPDGGEAFAITQGDEEAHSFDWSANSQTIFYATRQPWTKAQKDDYKKTWKDVVQYRTAERGDSIFSINIPAVIARHAAAPAKAESNSDKEENEDQTPGAVELAKIPLRIDQLITSPDGGKLAFLTNAINQRQEKIEDVELYIVNILSPTPQPVRVTHNQAVEANIRWAKDSSHIFFTVEVGGVFGPYRDLQPHLYWVDPQTVSIGHPDAHTIEQWDKNFIGPVEHYAVAGESVLVSARIGTEVQMYSSSRPSDQFRRISSWPGTYGPISTTPHSQRIAFIYSSLNKPEEIYLADSVEKLNEARAITSFNQTLAEKDLPRGKPYQWKADDGTTVEGMLIYPPGKFEAKNLPMFTFIHGGPADADGNHFGADWYDWAALAATNGWLVFRPNYRGSTGYGDKFLMQIVPQMVSRPGKDILEGVDALVKDGIADPDRLTIGGYSYGGYMTNWLITQTTRFKAAVTGAGAVENVGNWGNDDTTMDDAYFLGGRPWEAAQRYHDEAAIFQIDKVRTPTHMVAGADDIRVAVLEDYLLEHALYSLGIPNALLVFPGEGHSLDKNPWHGKIKVREELKWLEKYGGVPPRN